MSDDLRRVDYFGGYGQQSRPRLVDVVSAHHGDAFQYPPIGSVFDTPDGPALLRHPSAVDAHIENGGLVFRYAVDEVTPLAGMPEHLTITCMRCGAPLELDRDELVAAVATNRRTNKRVRLQVYREAHPTT